MKIKPISLIAYGLMSLGAAWAEDKPEPVIAPVPTISISQDVNNQFVEDLNNFYHAAITNSDATTSIESNAFSLVKLAKRDYQTFLVWYGEKANEDTSNNDYHLLQQQLLEAVGRQLIIGYSSLIPGDNTIEKGDNLRQVFSYYVRIIEKNNHSYSFIANGLKVYDSIIMGPLRSIKYDEFQAYCSSGPIGEDLIEGLLALFEISLKGVRGLLENSPGQVNADLKKLIFKAILNSEGFGDHPNGKMVNEDGIAKAHARLVDILVNNYFGVENNREDVEGLKLLIQSTASNFDVKYPKADWSPSILLPVIDRSRAYFQSALSKYYIEAMEHVSKAGNDKDEKKNQEIIKTFQFFSSLDCIAQLFFHPFPVKRLTSYYPSISPGLQERVGKFADELVKPIGIAYVHLFDNLTLEVKENRGERQILDSAWRSYDDYNLQLVMMNETLANEQVDILKSRLAIEQNLYIREALFRSIGIIASSNTDNETGRKAFKILETALIEETSYQSIRGIACGIAYNLKKDSLLLEKLVQFFGEINSSKNKHLRLQEILNDQLYLTLAQRFIIKAMYLTDDYLSTLAQDMHGKSKSSILKKVKDIHRQYSHNAFIFLAEVGRQLENDLLKFDNRPSSVPLNPQLSSDTLEIKLRKEISSFKDEVSKHLTRNLRMKILYVDTFMHPELKGESIGALLSLWGSDRFSTTSPEWFEKKVKDLGELFFGQNGKSSKPNEENETFGMVYEPVMEAYKRFILQGATKPGNHYDFMLAGNTPLDQIPNIKDFPGYDSLGTKSSIQALRIAKGMIKAAGNNQLRQSKQCLLEMASFSFRAEELLNPDTVLENNYFWKPNNN